MSGQSDPYYVLNCPCLVPRPGGGKRNKLEREREKERKGGGEIEKRNQVIGRINYA